MSNLPEWARDHDAYCGEDLCVKECLFYLALSIAWEALERISVMQNYHGDKSFEGRAKEAMRRIEEMGK